MKRFGVSTIRDAKLNNAVQFPLTDLDLGKHLTHYRDDRPIKNKDNTDSSSIESDSPCMLYDLCAVVNHVGTLSKGHYFAHVLEGGRWWFCNDGKQPVCIEAEDVIENSETGNPYILFYTRKKYSPNPTPSSS